MKKPTKADFRRFKAEALRMVQLLGLNEYTVECRFDKLDRETTAEITYNSFAGSAVICYNIEGETERSTPESCARHEVFHLLTAHLARLACLRFTRVEEIEREVEVIIRRLENCWPE